MMKHPQIETVGDFVAYSNQLQTLNRLLDMGLIQAVFPTYAAERLCTGILTNDMKKEFTYQLTDFGKVVTRAARTRLGLI